MRKYILIALIALIPLSELKAGGVGFGASVIYNFQTESWGSGLRVNFKPYKKFRVVPQLAYYPSFNKIHEYYIGLSLELNVVKIKKYTFYLLAHGAFNGWINNDRSTIKDAKYNNLDLEAGLGVVRNKGCWRPFLEYRYNAWWKEANLRLGIMYVFGCNDKYSSLNRQRRRAVSCPAYN